MESPPRTFQMRRVNGMYARTTGSGLMGMVRGNGGPAGGVFGFFSRQSPAVKVLLALATIGAFLHIYARFVMPLSGSHIAGGGNIGSNGLAPSADAALGRSESELRGQRKRRRKKRPLGDPVQARVEGGIRKAADAVSWLFSSSKEPAGASIVNTLPRSLDVCDHAACTGVTKVIAISLYGGDPRYTSGAVRNSEIMRDAFPDWQLWVYQPDPAVDPAYAVPQPILDGLKANGAKIIVVDKATIDQVGFGMNQRFLPAEDPKVDRFASRDGDSRLLLRERWAVDEWEEADVTSNGRFPFHVLRDHPSHSNFRISGGLWGAAKGSVPNIRQLLQNTREGKSAYLHDMNFLNSEVWPLMGSKGSMQHDAYSCMKSGQEGGLGFPRPRGGGEHVGGVYNGEDIVRAGDVALLPAHGQDPTCLSPDPPPSQRYGLMVTEILKCSLSLQALLGDTGELVGGAGGASSKALVAPANGDAGVKWSDIAASSSTSPSCDASSLSKLDDPSQLGLVIAGGTQWKRYTHDDMPRYRGLGVAGTVASSSSSSPDEPPQAFSMLFHWKQAFVDHGLWAAESKSASGCAGGADSRNSAAVGSWDAALSKAMFPGDSKALQAESKGIKTAQAIAPPTVFDYDRALLYSTYPLQCLPDEWLAAAIGKTREQQALSVPANGRTSAEPAASAGAKSTSLHVSLPLPSYAQVAQYHERIERPHTHYTSLGPGGLKQSAHLLVAQAFYTSDPHFIVSHAIPYVWYFLHSGPVPYRQVLLPQQSAAAEEVMAAMMDVGVFKAPIPNTNAEAAKTRGSYPAGAEERNNAAAQGKPWSEQPWVSLHSGQGAPSLHYAHRAYVAVLSGDIYVPQSVKLCSSVTALSSSNDGHDSLWDAVGTSAKAVAAHASLLFFDAALSPRDRIIAAASAEKGKCGAVLLHPSSAGGLAESQNDPAQVTAIAKATLATKGWAAFSEVNPCSSSVKEHLQAFGGAGVAVIPPHTLSPYLPYLRKGAKVLIAEDFTAGTSLKPSSEAAASAIDASVDSICAMAGLSCVRGPTLAGLLEGAVDSC